MTGGEEYIISCWHCAAPFNAYEASFCQHADPTIICPFCLKCFCDAPVEYKKNFVKNSPRKLLEEKIQLEEGRDLKLGERLIKAGKITGNQLKQAIENQKLLNKRLGEFIENKKAEKTKKALKMAEKKFRDLFDCANDAIVICNLEGHFLEVNKTFCERLGYTKEELLHLTPADINSPEYAALALERIEELKKKGSLFFETVHIRKDSKKIPIEVSSRLIEYEGNPAILSIGRDVTERKQAEKELHYQANLLENVSDAIISTDLNFTIKTWNKAAETTYGWRADEVIGKSIYDALKITYSDEQMKEILGEFLEKGNWEGEFVQKHKDGNPVHVFASVSLIKDSSKNPVGAVAVNRDISDQKRAEEALRQSEEKYRDLIETLNDVIYAVDQHGVITYVSPVIKSLAGYEESEVVGHHFTEFLCKEDLPRLEKDFQEILSGKSVANEYRAKTKSGKIRWVHTSGRPVFDKEGVCGVRGVLTDITGHKQAEEALEKSEQKYRQLIESLHEGIWVIDEHACTTFVNQRMAEMLGYTVDEMVGKHLFTFMDDENIETCKHYLERRRQGIKEQHDFEFLRKDRTRMYTAIETSPITDECGNYRGAIAGIIDITERRKAENLLRESEEMYRKLVETSPDAVAVSDLEGHIMYVSQRTVELHGFEHADELVGKDLSSLIVSEERERAMVNLEKVLREGVVRNTECTMVKKDGSRFISELNAALIRDSEGKPRAIIGSARDITERKRAEEQIKQSIKEKEVLLREIHHRVKNNMQVISSLLNLQSAHIKDSQYKEILKESQNRIRSMALVHERLYQSENLANIDFHEYITSLVRGLFRSYNATADMVSLVIEVEDVSLGVDAAVPCGLIINELVSNSLKHAFPGGRKGEIKIVLHSVCEMVELTVADNGVGIPEDVDFRTTESLGLDLVTTLAEYQLGGEITLDRSEGTAFCITFEGVKQW